MIAVMGATGNTGGTVAQQLLQGQARVRAIGRSKERLQPLVARGAEAAIGDIKDDLFLAEAFRDAEAVYAMIPPDHRAENQDRRVDEIGEATVRAINDTGVTHVVFLSSLGGELPSGTGPVAGLHRQEERLKRIPRIHLLILRPAYFFENHFGSLPLIKHQGINGGAIAPDVPFPMIATSDIGSVAAAALTARDFRGMTVRELLGPRDLTMREVTGILGGKIGRPDLPYVQFPDEAFVQGMVQAGFAEPVARLFVELSHAINERRVRSLEGRTDRNTTSTSFEEFANLLAAAYERL